jgi:hypothetical protein
LRKTGNGLRLCGKPHEQSGRTVPLIEVNFEPVCQPAAFALAFAPLEVIHCRKSAARLHTQNFWYRE